MIQVFFGIGLLLIAFGTWRAWDALHMEITVSIPGQEPVVNLALAQIQSLSLEIGLAAIIAGLLLASAAIIVERLPIPPTD